MANQKMKNISNMLSDGRTRTVLVFTVILLAVGVVFGFLRLRGDKGPAVPGGSNVASAPGGIQSIPGGFGTPESAEYARLQAQQNAQQAKSAGRSGKSAIPTLISSSSLGNQGFASSAPKGARPNEPMGCVAPGTNVYSASCQVVGTLGPGGVVQSVGGQNFDEPGKLVYGPNGQVIGRVGPNGEVLNAQGQVIGTVGPDGIVRGTNGQVIGQVSSASKGDLVYGPDGKVIGTIGPNGEVLNAQGQVIGHVGPNGEVLNAQGQVIGRASHTEVGQPVYGPDGKLLGTVGPNGEILNAQGQVVGRVGPNGEVLNAQGQVIGKVGSAVPGQRVYGPDGKVIGTIGPNGEVLNAQGQVIGHVGPNGEVIGPNGQIIGAVRTGTRLPPGTPLYDAYGNVVGTMGANGRLVPVSGGAPAATTVAGAPNTPPGTAGRPGAPGGPGVPGGPPVAGAPQMQAIMARQAAQLAAAENQQLKQQMQGGMQSQAGQLMSAWGPSTQQYVTGNPGGGANAAGVAGGRGGPGGLLGGGPGADAFGVNGGPIIKAGSIMFAVLNSTVSSDEPGPILATITSGALKGGTLIGSLTNQKTKVMITFNTLSYPQFPTSIGINSVAIDPVTAKTGLSDYTNNHYLLKYGTLFAASFMQGYAQAISQSGSTIVSNGFNTQKNMPTLSPGGQMVVALGNVGTQYASVLNGFQNVPPSVYVYAGTGVGVLVLTDLKLPAEVSG